MSSTQHSMGKTSHMGTSLHIENGLPNAKYYRCELSITLVILLLQCRKLIRIPLKMSRWHQKFGLPHFFTKLHRDIFTVKEGRVLAKSHKLMNTLLQANPNTQGLPAFYQENLTRIYHFVYVQVKNQEVAEELTSHVFLKAVQHLDDQRGSQSRRNWLLQIARTTVINYWCTVKHAPTDSLDLLLETNWEVPNKDTILEPNNNLAERVQRILQQLPERYREVLTYRFLLKLTVSEAAQIMGVTEANVKTLQFRALNRAWILESAMTDGD